MLLEMCRPVFKFFFFFSRKKNLESFLGWEQCFLLKIIKKIILKKKHYFDRLKINKNKMFVLKFI